MSDHHPVMESEGAKASNWVWALVAAAIAALVGGWLADLPASAALLFALVVFVVYAVVLAQFWEEPPHGDHDGHDHGHGHGHDHHHAH